MSSSSRPWLNWLKELPSSRTLLPPQYFQLYEKLTDAKFLRELTQENRQRLVEAFRSSSVPPKSAVLLAGGKSSAFELYDTDEYMTDFRQEMFFRYLFHVNEPDCYALISLDDGESTLFVPEVDEEDERWHGPRHSLDYYASHYGTSKAAYVNQILEALQQKGVEKLFLLHGQNQDSGLFSVTPVEFEGLDKFQVDKVLLHKLLVELRVKKTEKEKEIMRISNLISSQAHVYVMRHLQEGMSEFHAEALYKVYCQFFGGARHMAYSCICASSGNGAILHYGHAGRPNDRVLSKEDRIVLDMGAEFAGYATDITRSYPVGGKFSDDQKIVHNAVVAAQKAVMAQMKPGAFWPDLHRLAEKVILEHLLAAQIVHNGTVEEMMAVHLGSVFMPHGLGHFLGMAVHDVGGYEEGKSRAKEPGLCWLRCGRALEKDMVLTVEPGLYFNDNMISKALKDEKLSKFLNEPVLDRFRGTGGCRMEDDVLVTEDGCENMTILPTTVEEIEEVILQEVKV